MFFYSLKQYSWAQDRIKSVFLSVTRDINSSGVSLVHFLCTCTWILKYSLLPGKVEHTNIKLYDYWTRKKMPGNG